MLRYKLFSISSKQLIALSGRFLMTIRVDKIESSSEAGDLLELIAFFSAISKKSFLGCSYLLELFYYHIECIQICCT
jgi:hypothetical protein